MSSKTELAGEFARTVRDALTKPRTLGAHAARGMKRAVVYFILLLCGSSIVGSVLQLAPSMAAMLSQGEFEQAFARLPDFKISGGKFTLTGNQTEPLYVTEYLVIDTTGNVTEPPVDGQGDGILITADGILQSDRFRKQALLFKDMDDAVTSKADLLSFMKTLVLLSLPLALGFMVVFKVLAWGLFCLMYGSLMAFSAKALKKIPLRKGLVLAAYAQTPIIISTVISPILGGLLLTFISIIWAGAVYYVAVRENG